MQTAIKEFIKNKQHAAETLQCMQDNIDEMRKVLAGGYEQCIETALIAIVTDALTLAEFAGLDASDIHEAGADVGMF